MKRFLEAFPLRGSPVPTSLNWHLRGHRSAKIADWLLDFTGSLSNEESRFRSSLAQRSDINLRLFGVGLQVYRKDEMSRTMLSFERLENYDGSDAEKFGQARFGADPDFIRYSGSVLHRQFLDAGKVHAVTGRFTGIASNERLVPAKMATLRRMATFSMVSNMGFSPGLTGSYSACGTRLVNMVCATMNLSMVAHSELGRQ